jgi:hypothetical protein
VLASKDDYLKLNSYPRTVYGTGTSLKTAMKDRQEVLGSISGASGDLEDLGQIRLAKMVGEARPPERSPSPQETSDGANDDSDSHRGDLYYWEGGRVRRVPESFKVPICSPLELWQQWLCGNHELGYPPLRLLETPDLKISMRKRMYDARNFMKRLETRASELDIVIPRRPTLAEANDIFHRCESVIVVPRVTRKRRQRQKRNNLAWRTVYDILRQLDKTTETSLKTANDVGMPGRPRV